VIPIKDNIPNSRFGFVTFGLIVANFVVYVLAIRHGGSFISGPEAHETFRYGAIPYAILHPGVHCAEVVNSSVPNASAQILCNTHRLNASHIPAENLLPSWETIFTGMFMHASIIHIGGNMIFLWIFGKSVEAAMGPIKYLAFYIAGGVAALALQIAVAPHSTAPTLGAAGAIAAVIGAYIVLYARARVLTFVPIIFLVTVIELPPWVLLALWFAAQAVFAATGLTSPGSTGDAPYFAQIGGFLLGLLTVRLIVSKSRRIPVPPRHPVNA
jgi:membrane associated rhomboid family serine protease